jgi:hypothetical protein
LRTPYCGTRLERAEDRAFGELPPGYPARAIVGAVTPPVG